MSHSQFRCVKTYTETCMAKSLRQAYDYWQDQPGFSLLPVWKRPFSLSPHRVSVIKQSSIIKALLSPCDEKKHQSVFAVTTRITTLTRAALTHHIKFQRRNSTLCFNSEIDPRIVLRETRFALRTNTNFNRNVLANGVSH